MSRRVFYLVVEEHEASGMKNPITATIVDRESLELKGEYTDHDGDVDYACRGAVRAATDHGDDLKPGSGR